MELIRFIAQEKFEVKRRLDVYICLDLLTWGVIITARKLKKQSL
jgi:hypothetical protein